MWEKVQPISIGAGVAASGVKLTPNKDEVISIRLAMDVMRDMGWVVGDHLGFEIDRVSKLIRLTSDPNGYRLSAVNSRTRKRFRTAYIKIKRAEYFREIWPNGRSEPITPEHEIFDNAIVFSYE